MNWGIVLSNSFPEKIRIFDTTLRDGEQTPENKLRIAKSLDKLGVDVTEAGFAVASDGEMNPIKLEELLVVTGDRVTPTASVRLNLNGNALTEAATCVGPVDAAMKPVKKSVLAVEPIQLENYSVKAITGGTDAVAELSVRLGKGDRMVTAIGVNEAIGIASVEAMLTGMNVMMTNYNKLQLMEVS